MSINRKIINISTPTLVLKMPSQLCVIFSFATANHYATKAKLPKYNLLQEASHIHKKSLKDQISLEDSAKQIVTNKTMTRI